MCVCAYYFFFYTLTGKRLICMVFGKVMVDPILCARIVVEIVSLEVLQVAQFINSFRKREPKLR